jgi:hypothetical protein
MRMRYIAAALALLAGLRLLAGGGADAQGNGQGWGTIKGQIVKAGPVPKPMEIAAVKTHQDRKHCEANGPILDEDWVVNPKNHGVRWAFVWLQPDAAKGQAKLPINPKLQAIQQKEVTRDQPTCAFVPHAMAMREGQVLVAQNRAPMPHNYKWGGNPAKNPGGNVLIPSKGQVVINNLVADRFPISVSCTIHPWMKAWVRVFDHPYFAVTDENGTFEIKDAPAGEHRLVVWQESIGWGTPGGKNGEPITVKAGAVTEVPRIELK